MAAVRRSEAQPSRAAVEAPNSKVPQAKTRSRKDGAAIPLDDTDKRLMNLLQSNFPLAPEPYARLAAEHELDLDDLMTRTDRLVSERIIREITPIFDTRALGYESMLVAAKVDAEHPQRAAKIINSHPGVSHNYLRTHEFNLWFTIATPPDSELGLQGTLDVLQRLTGAESIRQLPTLKLFKINMNLEMEKGTEALATAAEAATPRELERQPYDDTDIAVIRALQGPMEVADRPYDAAAAEVGMSTEAFLDHLRGMVDRKILRRVAAILYHRRAGFSANGMGVWKVPGRADPRGRRRAWRRCAGSRTATSVRPTPTGRTRCSRWPTGAPRRSATRSCSRSPTSTTCTAQTAPPSTPRPSTRRSGCTTSRTTTRSGKPSTGDGHWSLAIGGQSATASGDLMDTRTSEVLYARAAGLMPGGVNSPVRAMKSIGRDYPIFVERGDGFELIDVDGHRYVDWVCSWGPLILGHADPDVVEAVRDAAGRGTSYGAPTEGEVELAAEVCDRFASVQSMRMVNSGTEATMSAIRLARAVTGREQLIKFAGAYHGHVDGLLAEAGSGLATQGIPASPGVPAAQAAATVVVPWNDPEAVAAALAAHEVAAILAEPLPANMGVVQPDEGFLAELRRLADEHGALLVLDEVISGFRVARGGAQERYGVEADLTIMGKVLGGGLPAAAYGGRRELMERVAPAGDVYQAGTLSGNPLAVAAGLATLAKLDRGAYERLGALTEQLAAGLRAAAAEADVAVQVASVPGLVTPFFAAAPVRDFAGASACDLDAYGALLPGDCSTGASIHRRRSSRPGSSRSPTTRRRSSTPARPPPRSLAGRRERSRADALRDLAAPAAGRRLRGQPARRRARRRPTRPRASSRRPARARPRRRASTRSWSRPSARDTSCTTATARVVRGAEPDLALLAGDYLYALGLERLAALGDLEPCASSPT